MPDNRESRSVGDSLHLIFRNFPLMLIAAAVCGVGAYVVSPSGGAVDSSAEATIGLSTEVGFPFYAQTRDSYVARSVDDGIAERILESFDGTVTELTATASVDDSTRTDIAAKGSNDADVVAAANQLSDELVALSKVESEAFLTAERDLLVADQEALDAEIAELNAELAEATTTEAAARLATANQNSPTFEADLIELRLAEQARSALTTRVSSLERQSAELTDDVLQADRSVALLRGELVVVSEAEAALAAPSDRSTVAVLGALAGLVLSALAITTFLGGRSKVRRSSIEDRYPTVPVLDGDGGQDISPFNADLWDSLVDGPSSIGVLRTESAADLELDWMKRTELDATIGTPDATVALSNSELLVIVCTKADRIETVDSIDRAIESFGRRLAMIVIDAG